MDQNFEQISKQRDHLFKPGRSGNPLGRGSRVRRVAAKAEELAAEFGGLDAMPASDRAVLAKIADMVISTSNRDPVRELRAIERALSRLRANAEARKPQRQTLADYLRGKNERGE